MQRPNETIMSPLWYMLPLAESIEIDWTPNKLISDTKGRRREKKKKYKSVNSRDCHASWVIHCLKLSGECMYVPM